MRSLIERFEEKVNLNGPVSDFRPDLGRCWIWVGTRTKGGYGMMRWIAWRQSPVPAHVVSLYLYQHLLPIEGHMIQADHLCRVRACVNPNHLERVSADENLRRSQPYRTAGIRLAVAMRQKG